MTINLSLPELTELTPRITVIGVGGAGGNAVNNMIRANLQGVDFVVANTDAQALMHSEADKKVQLGAQLTQGLGAGARPDVGRAAAEESLEQVNEYLAGCHMVFVTAGMGGGTGTGAAPIIARLAREQGILTVGVITKPFQFEGSRRMRLAEEGIQELQKYVDTLIIIPNQNLFRIATEKTTFADAFAMADEVLHSGVRGVTDLMIMPGLVNLDFADVRTVMSEMGKAMMGTGEAEGENRALEAAEAAISNPLLDEVSMKGAKGVLINITGGMDLTLFEVDEAANRIRNEVDPDANILVGSALDENLNGSMRVSVVATGIEAEGQFSAPERVVAMRGVAEAVAAPRPAPQIVAEPEVAVQPMMVTTEQQAPTETPAQVHDTFIAPAPMEPEAPLAEATGTPDPFAEAAFSNGDRPQTTHQTTDQAASQSGADATAAPAPRRTSPAAEAPRGRPAPRPRTQNLSWFERVTGRGRGDSEDGRSDLFEEKAPASQPVTQQPKISPAPEARVRPVATPSVNLGSVGAEDRIAPKRTADDQLEIPTFLRRQAN
ncbi:MAG: cell division protein FtsZ [Sphingomonadales bacterium]